MLFVGLIFGIATILKSLINAFKVLDEKDESEVTEEIEQQQSVTDESDAYWSDGSDEEGSTFHQQSRSIGGMSKEEIELATLDNSYHQIT